MPTIKERLANMRNDAYKTPEEPERDDLHQRITAMRENATAELSTMPRRDSDPLMDLALGTVTKKPTARRDSHDVLHGIESNIGDATRSYTARENAPRTIVDSTLKKNDPLRDLAMGLEAGKVRKMPGMPGGGGRGFSDVADLDPETATPGDYMAAIARDQQRGYTDMFKHDDTPVAEQRRKTNEAFRTANAFVPLENQPPEAWNDYNDLYDAAVREDEKLKAMGGTAARELPVTLPKSFAAGTLGAVRGIHNLAGYVAQMGAESEMNANAEMWRRMGREDYAEDMEAIRDELNLNGLENWADYGQNYINDAAKKAAGYGKIGQALSNVAQGVGGMVPSIVSNLVAPGSGLPVMFLQASGNATEEALNAGADKNAAALYGTAVGAVEVLTEKMFGGIPGLGIGAVDDAVENAIKNAVGNEATQRAILFFVDALGEGAEEFTSEFADWALNKWLVGEDKRDFREVHKDAWYSALIGALTSVAMQAPVQFYQNARREDGYRALLEEVQAAFEQKMAEKTEKTEASSGLSEQEEENENAVPEGTATVSAEQLMAETENEKPEWLKSSERNATPANEEMGNRFGTRDLSHQITGDTAVPDAWAQNAHSATDSISAEMTIPDSHNLAEGGEEVNKRSPEGILSGRTPAWEESTVRRQDTSPAAELQAMAKQSGFGEKGAETLGTFYAGGDMAKYYGGFAAMYNAGRAGQAAQTVRTQFTETLSPQQREAAWYAGRMDAITTEAAETKNAPAAGALNLMTGGQSHAEGNNTFDGSRERDAGLRAGEQAGKLAGSTGKAAAGEVRTASQRHALIRDLRLRPADPVNDFGIRNAVNTGETYVLPEEQIDAPLRKIAEKNSRSGVETVFILGGISIRKSNGTIKRARGVYVPSTNTVIIQADNISATPEQIAEHELWHARYQHVPAQDRLLEERIRERYTDKEFEKVLDRYIGALYGVIDLHEDMSDAEYDAALGRIKNELFADAVSGLNGFGAGATQFTETAQQFRDEYWGSSEQTAEATENTTGPPAEAQFSMIGTNEYGDEIYETPNDLKNLSYDEKIQTFKENFYREGSPQYIGKRVRFQTSDGFYFAEIDRQTQRENTKKLNPKHLLKSEKAKVNVGAAGDFITLLENTRLDSEGNPITKNNTDAKKRADSMDYHLKDVVVDGMPFEVVVNVINKDGGHYVYEVKLKPNKNRPLNDHQIVKVVDGRRSLGTESHNRSRETKIADLWEDVNTQFSIDEDADTDEIRENDADERAKSFSYDALIKKDPVRVVQIQSRDIPTRGKRINANALAADARAKAPVIVYQAQNGDLGDLREQRYVYVPDLGANVLFSTKGVLHGAVGNIANTSTRTTAEITPDLAEILQNSIKVNERGPRENPKRGDGEYSHILIGAAQNEKGDVYIIRSQINHFANNKSELESVEIYDVLKGAKAKKTESEVMRTLGIEMPQPHANTTDSYYTVADLLALVKENYPNILPKDVLAHFGIDASVQDEGIMFSTDEDTDTDKLRQELRARGNVETRRNLADTDRAAFRENENQRRQLRKDIRETENRPKEIAAVEQELVRLRDTGYQQELLKTGGLEAMAKLRNDIARLEQRLQRLKGEKAETKPAKNRKKAAKKTNAPTISVRQLQNDLLRYFSVPEGQRAELGKFVANFANKIYREGQLTQADYDTLMDRLYESGVVTVPATEYQKAGRDAVKDGRIYVPQNVKSEFGDDWNSFRAKAWGAGIYLVNDTNARGADQWNVELSELFPGIFSADNLDQRSIIEQIVQLAEEGKDQKMSLSDYTAMLAGQEYTTEDVLQDEMERHIDWALRTFAEKAGLEVFLKDRTDARVQQERAAAWERRQQEAERKRTDREIRELQQKTLKQLQWLSANRNKAPTELRQAFDDVLSDIDIYAASAANALNWSKRYQMTWKDLVDLYDAKTNEASPEYDPNFFPSDEMKRIYERLRVKKQYIADMDIGTLQDLYKAAAGLRQEVYDRNNLINDEFNRTVAGAYYDSKAELEAAAKDQRKKNLLRKYDEMQLTPMNRFESMAGWKKDSTWASMARMLEKGERDQRHFTVNAKAMLADFLKQNQKWVQRADGQGKDGIWYEVEFSPVAEWGEMDKPILGKPVKVWMTPAMKVQLYLESKSEDNLRHMAGGRTFADKELYAKGERSEAYANGRTFKMTPEAVRKIVSDLTEEEKALADVLEKFYNEFSKGEINRVSNALYGYDKAMGRYYAPIFTDSNYTQSSPGIFDLTAEGVGNLKERRKSWTPSMMISAFDAFEKSVDKTAKFVGLAIPIRNMNTLWNWWEDGGSMKDVVEHAQGQEAAKFVEDLMTELQGNKEMKHPKLEQLMDKALSKYVSAVFGFNPSIVLKQFASFPLAASYLGWGNMPAWIPGAAQVDRELIQNYTGELGYRNMGYATPETALLKDNPGALQKKGILNFVFGGGAINWMDDFTVRSLWTWAENKVRKDQPNLRPGTQEGINAGTDAFYKAVASEFEEAVSRSQPMYDTMHRSQVMREGGGLARAFTMFKTVPQQEYNMLREAFGEMAAAKESGDAAQKKAAAAKAGRAVTGVMVGNLMIGAITFLNALLKNGAKGYRDDKDELTPESVMKQLGAQYFRDSIGLAIGGDVIADVLGAAFGARWYGVDAPGVEQVNEILEGAGNAGKNMQRLVKDSIEIASNGGDWQKYMREHGFMYTRAVEDAVKLLGTYAGGLPVNNVRAYLLGALQWMSPEIKVAYEDAVKHADRSGLKGLTGAALEMRAEHILSNRLDEPSEELVKALSDLYAAGHTNTIPTDTPSKVSIDDEDYDLDLLQQQTYSNKWRDAVGDELEDLIASDAFRNAAVKAQASMVRKIYDYAANAAKGAVFSQFDAEEKNKTANAAMKAGASLNEWAWISARFSEIDREKTKSTEQRNAMKRAEILNMDLTDQEKLDLYSVMAPADSRTEKLQAIKNTGMSTKRAFAVYDKYEEIDAAKMTASEKAANFSKWIDEQKFTERQAATIREQLAFRTSSVATAGAYDKFTSEGLSPNKSYMLFETLQKLEPEEGKETVSNAQKLHAIAEAKLTDAEKISAMGAIMGTELINEYGNPTAYAKMMTLVNGGTSINDYLKLSDAGQVDGYIKLQIVTAGMGYQISAGTFVQYRQSVKLYDADGNGSYTQKEIEAALDALQVGGDNPLLGSGLTTAQKAVLWQFANSSWKPGKNPYNTRIGQDVYDALQELKELDALKAINSGSDNPLQLGGISDAQKGLMELALSMLG